MNYLVVVGSTMSLPKRLLCSGSISKASALALPRSLAVGLTNTNWGPPGSSPYEVMLRRMASDGALRQRAMLENCIDDTSWKRGCEALLEAGKREGAEKILGEVNAYSDGALLRAVVETAVKTATSPQEMKRGGRRMHSLKKKLSSNIERERLALILCQRNVENGLMHSSLYNWVVKWCQENEKERLGAMNTLLKHCDLSRPEQWYGHTRLMHRRVIFHGGPTNSGKTHNALERLKMARGGECGTEGGGIYCSPLRLLALEIYNRLNQEGIYTDLLTGQERRQMPFATHTACTVELANIGRTFDVAVVDEIQMIADPQRGDELTSSSSPTSVQLNSIPPDPRFCVTCDAIGHSWTRALLGLRARELHVCGGMEAAGYVRRICERTGDSFQIYEYERKSPLHAQTSSLDGDFSKIRPGDCIVAFSKKNLYSIRREVENSTRLKCCLVYGQLPPETRRGQADLFNATDSGYDVLVASDAIGMGLNLNMRRVIFHTTHKRRDNDVKETIPATLIKQIAGRAGRFSSQWGSGEVTCLNHEDMEYMRSCLATPLEPLCQGGVFPPQEQIASFLDALSKSPLGDEFLAGDDDVVASPQPGEQQDHDPEMRKTTAPLGSNMVNVIKKFLSLAHVESDFFLCGSRETEAVAEVLKEVPGLSLGQCYELCLAPVNYRDHLVMGHMQRYAARYANGKTVGTNVKLPMKNFRPKQLDDVNRLCSKYASLDLYVWLCNKLPRVFVEGDLAFRQREYAVFLIDQALHSSILGNKVKKTQVIGRKLSGRGLAHLRTHQSKVHKPAVTATAQL